jgi:hypothetical protein
MNGHSIVVKQPIGKIKVTKTHKTPLGKIFTENQVLDYYSIFTTKPCNCGNDTKSRKSYRVKGGTIPFEKAIVVE